MDTFKIAHLSDPHFAQVSYGIHQFFSKRWLGNWNLILFRKKRNRTEHILHLAKTIEALNVDSVFITGDFSTTSLEDEFLLAQSFIRSFSVPVYVLPGNHDVYTRKAEKGKIFYDFFQNEEMRKKRIFKKHIKTGWWIIGLDCARANPLFSSNGFFFPELEEALELMLSEIPLSDNVIILNHFPLFNSGRRRHDLIHAERLQAILKKYFQVKIYLHGHDHHPYVIDRTHEGFPLVVNSGSCSHIPNGTFFLIEMEPTGCLIERLFFKKDGEEFSWIIDEQKHYAFKPSKI
jgi:3',5'-cyclic AMP phosphodiesterase CpdA